jgi:hypothetical protein
MKRYPPESASPDAMLEDVVSITALMLSAMKQTLRGDMVDEALFRRIFGSSEGQGLVLQLQRLCGVLSDAASLARTLGADAHGSAEALSEEQRVLMQYYLERLPPPNAGDALSDSAGE